jgi:hypothetical protein
VGRSRHARGRAIAVVAAAGASLALAAPAMAVKSKQAKFKIEVSGKQDSDWTYDSGVQSSDCGGGTYRQAGGGGQSFSFTTKKPVKVTAVQTRIQGQTFSAIYRGTPTNPDPSVPVNVAAIREGTFTTTQLSPGDGVGCGDGGGGPPAPPDCGSRNFLGKLNIGYYSPEQYPGDPDEPTPLVDVLTLDGPFDDDGDRPLDEAWTNCPGPPNDEGGLMQTPTGGLPAKKLFGDKKEFKVKAKDSRAFSSNTTQETTQMNWTVEFTRRGG